MTGVSQIKARQRWKTCEDNTFCRKRYGRIFLGLSRRLMHRFSDRTKIYKRSLLFEAS